MRGRVLVGVLATAVTLGLAGAAASGRSTFRQCIVQGRSIVGIKDSRVIATRGAMVVYRVRGATSDTWWACLGVAPGVLIGHDNRFQSRGSEYGPSTTLGRLHSSIGWLFLVGETGQAAFASCTKYAQYPCPGPILSLLAVPVGSGGHPGTRALVRYSAERIDAAGDGTGISFRRILTSLQPAAVAWLLERQPFSPSGSSQAVYALYGCIASAGPRGPACTPREYAHGDIDPNSVMLATSTLSWRERGRPGVAVLAR